MSILKKIFILLLMFFIGGIVLQSIGYIDWPLFAWFTEIEFFEV